MGHHHRRPSAPTDHGAQHRGPHPDDAPTTTHPCRRIRRMDQGRTRPQRNARTVLTTSAPKMPSRTRDETTSVLILAWARRHFRSTDYGLVMTTADWPSAYAAMSASDAVIPP